jgi:hypothetical protein
MGPRYTRPCRRRKRGAVPPIGVREGLAGQLASAHQPEAAAKKSAERSRPEKAEVAPQPDVALDGAALRWALPGQQYAPPPDPASRQRSLLALQRTVGNRRATEIVARSPGAVLLRDRSPAATPPAKPGYDPSPDQARAGLISALGDTDLGRKAGAIFNQYGVGIHWTDSGTAGFEDRTNVVHLNRKMRSYELAAYFIHEMHHAQQFNSGASKGPETYADSEKEKYVKTMVAEELEATFRQFESMYQAGTTSLAVTGVRPELPPTYSRTRKYWIDRHLKENPGDTEGAEKLSVSKCRALIKYWFTRQSRGASPDIAPNQFQSYEEYYRGMFESAQRNKAAAPAPPGGTEAEPTAEAEPLEHEESKALFPQEATA